MAPTDTDRMTCLLAFPHGLMLNTRTAEFALAMSGLASKINKNCFAVESFKTMLRHLSWKQLTANNNSCIVSLLSFFSWKEWTVITVYKNNKGL